MKSLTIKKLYKLHSWVGIITGILLFIIAFTGAVAVFAKPELTVWANNAIRGPIESTSAQLAEKVHQHAAEVGPEYLEEVHIQLPDAKNSATVRLIYEGHFIDENGKEEHKGVVYELDPNTLKITNKTDMESFFSLIKLNMATFIAHFHADLHLGRPIGLILTGLLGLTLMVSIATGIVIHRKILAQLFTFRLSKSFSLALNDGHKVMSVWAVLFHSMIAFTGAFLGLATVILVPAAAYVSFNGDQEKLIETFTAIKPPIMAEVAATTKLATILQASEQQRPDLTFNRVAIMGYGDKNALVYLFGTGGEQLGGETLIYQGSNAEYINTQANFGRLEGITGKILDAMFPLHFGNFGGVFIKAIWAILGLSTALIPISGIMLWIERGMNAKHPAHSRETYIRFNKLLIGSCAGLVLATVVLFPTQLIVNKWYPGIDATSLLFYVFFITWFLACCLPFVMSAKKAMQCLTLTTSWLLILIMPMDAILTNSHLLNVFVTGHYVSVGVDLVLCILGIALLLMYQKLNSTLSLNETYQTSTLQLKEGI
ncbi:PepSY-associated TM helix domain-containing protein [Shewanella japonica]|uniref:PepSY domain-containing protein n=1 Tax=Shewanella japonica TaxID=93973 RepID=A0ABN4YNZ1_9GAMM|nr:PepSY-associated TM helix domain-containing protein [Shewanella japonica]ARD22602.1 hypothetical protein SJ2017_2312 [Shewanella japonica]